MPRVSIIMPMKNAEAFVAEAIASVLSQNADVELIVVDDGSTDRSAERVRTGSASNVRLVTGPRRGISAAFNAGLAAATAPLLARCDADDLYTPGRLDRQMAFLIANPNCVAVAGGYSTMDVGGNFVADYVSSDRSTDVTQELLSGKGRSHMCAYLFRTDVIRAVGGCREWFVTSEDADLQYRLAERGPVGYEAFDAYRYRLHDTSITHTQSNPLKKWYADQAAVFLEQRRRGGRDDLDRGNPPLVPQFPSEKRLCSAQEIQDRLLAKAWQLHRQGDKSAALREGWRAAKARPGNLTGWRSYVSLWVKRSPST
jgi:glycosyltransferase involved in cell wall biosynthesis